MTRTSLAVPLRRELRGPRTGPNTATLASLALRGYIAFVWLKFGVMKLQDGWLTANPLKPLFTMIAAGQLPSTAPGYAWVAKLMLVTHADAVLSVMIPVTEVAIALALLFNVRTRTAALVASALNVNVLLAGVASIALDGRMIVLQLLLVAVVTLTGGQEVRRSVGQESRSFAALRMTGDRVILSEAKDPA